MLLGFRSYYRRRLGNLRLPVVALALLTAAGSFDAASANPKYAGLVVDAKTGKVLYSSNAHARRYPASLTKMMTLYVLFEEMERGRFTESTRLKVSANAAAQQPSKLGLRAGQTIRVRDAIRALAVKSANDVAVVVAESVSGSVPEFARRMTNTARALGMTRTTFKNPSGLPNSGQVTTAHDMAILGRALHDRFPDKFSYFSTRTFKYGKRTYTNTNRLLGRVEGVEGIKTGYTRASGFNLVTSVKKDRRHIVAVVMGGKSGKSRNAHMQDLIGRYMKKASKGRRTAPLIASRSLAPPILPKSKPIFVAASRPTGSITSAKPVMANAMPYPEKLTSKKGHDPIAAAISTVRPEGTLAYAATRRRGQTIDDSAMNSIAFAQGSATELPLVLTPPQGADAARHGGSLHNRAQEPASVPKGWHIQIGAVPTRSGAQELLTSAKSRAGDILASADPFTQPVDKNGTTLYRARFAGFSGKSEARQICKSLKKRAVDCLAVPN